MRILIILASGIGNSILFSPTLVAIRKNFINAEIDVFAYKKSFAEPFTGSNLVNTIFYMDGLNTIFRLRKRKYDVSITAFPSNRWQFNLFAFFVGAKKRVTHKYKTCGVKTLSFLQNYKIVVNEKIHDVEQNLQLLEAIGAERPSKPELYFFLDEEDDAFGEKYIKDNFIENNVIIGIHVGCNKLQKFRRWPKENFIELINKISFMNKNCIIFAGPDDYDDTKYIYDKLEYKTNVRLIANEKFKRVAAVIKRCTYFICTDSGLGHTAAALGVKTFAIFGPAVWSRTAPYGNKSKYIIAKDISCSPCSRYPFYSSSSKIDCKNQYKCLSAVKVSDVLQIVFK
jgi:ADP-heptose:LPS heptosyltransferase